jgi:hypothetical protein
MPSVSEVAKSWRVSHQYVSKLAKRGLPLNASLEEATAWRAAHAMSKAPTDPTALARRLTQEKTDRSSAAPLHRDQPRAKLEAHLTGNPKKTNVKTIPLATARKIVSECYDIMLGLFIAYEKYVMERDDT